MFALVLFSPPFVVPFEPVYFTLWAGPWAELWVVPCELAARGACGAAAGSFALTWARAADSTRVAACGALPCDTSWLFTSETARVADAAGAPRRTAAAWEAAACSGWMSRWTARVVFFTSAEERPEAVERAWDWLWDWVEAA